MYFQCMLMNCFFLKALLSIDDDMDNPDDSVFYQVQSLFGHLMESKLQYYIPENFWKVILFILHDAFQAISCLLLKCKTLCLTLSEYVSLPVKTLFEMATFWNTLFGIHFLCIRSSRCGTKSFMSVNNKMHMSSSPVSLIRWMNTSRLVLYLIYTLYLYSDSLRKTWGAFYKLVAADIMNLLQKIGRDQIFKNTFQGIYSDQKICKDCPHR